MPRSPIKSDDAEQSKRFIEAAEEVGADDEKVLGRAFAHITAKASSKRKKDQDRSSK